MTEGWPGGPAPQPPPLQPPPLQPPPLQPPPPGPDGLTWLAPSSKLWAVRIIQTAAATVVVLVIALLIADGSGGGAVGIAVTAAVVLAVAVVAAITMRRRVRAWGYAEREDDLLVRRGLWFRRLSVVPYGRMQFVDMTAGPFERVFGLATVRMHTAAAASDARIPGLPVPEAERLRDQLTALGEAQAAGL